MTRSAWTSLTDAQLLAQCDVDTYRASGPGGQKRNKTSSAVRLRHEPSGLIVIAEESRSQHENKAKALRRLKQALYLKLREPAPLDGASLAEIEAAGRARAASTSAARHAFLAPPSADPRRPGGHAGACQRHRRALGTTTANIIHFLQSEPKVWEEVNHLRAARPAAPRRIGGRTPLQLPAPRSLAVSRSTARRRPTPINPPTPARCAQLPAKPRRSATPCAAPSRSRHAA
ncbi:MAG: peptide chain release factor-like protein [Gemmataceae bacterium]